MGVISKTCVFRFSHLQVNMSFSLVVSDFREFFFLFLRNNYNMLLTSQFKSFLPRPPSTLYIERYKFSYKAFGRFSGILKINLINNVYEKF